MELNCKTCKQCNRKGKPSVSKGSTYCRDHRIKIKEPRFNLGIFTKIKNRMFDKRVEYDKKGKIKNLKTKGFRKSWFWR